MANPQGPIPVGASLFNSLGIGQNPVAAPPSLAGVSGDPLADLHAALSGLSGIAAQNNALGNSIASSPPVLPTYTSPLSQPGNVDWGSILNAASKVTEPSVAPSLPSGNQDVPWWKQALDTLSGAGKLITNPIYDAINNSKTPGGWDISNWKNYPILDDLYQVGSGEVNKIKQDASGTPTAGGFLKLLNDALNPMSVAATGLGQLGQNGKSTSDILNKVGWQTNANSPLWDKVAHGVTSFVGDVGLDPTTYLSFGAGGIIKKAGEKAAESAAANVAKDAGVQVAKDATGDIAKGTAQQIYNKTVSQFTGNAHVNQDLVQRLAQKKYDDAIAQINQAVAQARNSVQNSLVNVDVPFTNIAKSIAQRPGFLTKTADTIGEQGAAGLSARLNDLGITNPEDVSSILNKYGVSDAKNLTIGQANNLHGFLDQTGAKKLSDLQTELSVAPGTYKTTEEIPSYTMTQKLGGDAANKLSVPTDPNVQLRMVHDLATMTPQQIRDVTGMAFPDAQKVADAVKASAAENKPLQEVVDNLPTKMTDEQKTALVANLEKSDSAKNTGVDIAKAQRARSTLNALIDGAKKDGKMDTAVYNTAVKYLDRLPQDEAAQFKSQLDALAGVKSDVQVPQEQLLNEMHNSLVDEKTAHLTPNKEPVPAPAAEPTLYDKMKAEADKQGINLDQVIQRAGQPSLQDILQNGARHGLPDAIRPGNKVLDTVAEPTTITKNVTKPTEVVSSKAVRTPAETISKVMTKKLLTKMASGSSLQDLSKFKAGANRLTDVINELAKNGTKYTEDATGRSFLSRFISDRALKAFNPRTLGSADAFVNHMANLIRDTENRVRGGHYQAMVDTSRLSKMAKDMSSKELEAVGYMVENKFPGSAGIGRAAAQDKFMQGLDGTKVEAMANEVRKIFGNLAQREIAAGSLDHGGTLDNYMYHLYNKTGMNKDELDQFMSSPGVKKWIGQNGRTGINLTRQGFKTLADYKDAQNSLQHAYNTVTDAADKEDIQSKLDRLQGLMEQDPTKVVAVRYQQHIQSAAMSQLSQEFLKNGVLRKGAGMIDSSAPGNFKRLSQNEMERMGLTKPGVPSKEQYYLHNDVYKGMQKVSSLFTDEGLNKFVNYFDHVTNIMKSFMVTWYVPHQYTRWVGNTMQASFAGATPSDFKQAVQLLQKAKAGNLAPEEEKMMQAAYDKGILVHFNNSWTGNISKLPDTKLGEVLGKAENWVHNNAYAHKMNQSLDFSDNLARLAVFARGMKAYGNANHAADLVRKYMFNYNEMGSADRFIKRVVPFWSWTRNNLPLQVMEFMRQPRYFQTYEKFQNALNPKDQNGNPMHPYPDYGQDYLHVGGNYFWNPKLPLEDLTNYGTPTRAFQSVMGSLNPLIADLPQIYTNQQFFDHAPIDKYAISGALPSAGATAKFLFGQLGAPSKVSNIFTDTTSPLWQNIMGALSPVGKPVMFDPAKLATQQKYVDAQIKAKATQKKNALAKAQAAKSGG